MTTTTVVRDPVTPERVSPLKPSEALRLGRLIRPVRCSGRFFRDANAACANGAIAVGLGYEPPLSNESYTADEHAISFIEERWPSFPWIDVFIRNDIHHWSDDQIAAYLEGLGL